MTAIRVLVVDDHTVVRRGLATVIGLHDDLEHVGEASNGEEAVELCASVVPDVVLMDMRMPVMDGPTAIAQISEKFPSIRIVALTSFIDDSLARRALEAGATSYLFKDADEDDVVGAIRLAYRGSGVVAPEALRALIASETTNDSADVDLTSREQATLELVARGLLRAEIDAVIEAAEAIPA